MDEVYGGVLHLPSTQELSKQVQLWFSESPLQVEFSPERGVHLVSKRNIEAGEKVLWCPPLVAVVFHHFASSVCHNCFKLLEHNKTEKTTKNGESNTSTESEREKYLLLIRHFVQSFKEQILSSVTPHTSKSPSPSLSSSFSPPPSPSPSLDKGSEDSLHSLSSFVSSLPPAVISSLPADSYSSLLSLISSTATTSEDSLSAPNSTAEQPESVACGEVEEEEVKYTDEGVLACSSCESVMYCSRRCKTADQLRFHQLIECRGLRALKEYAAQHLPPPPPPAQSLTSAPKSQAQSHPLLQPEQTGHHQHQHQLTDYGEVLTECRLLLRLLSSHFHLLREHRHHKEASPSSPSSSSPSSPSSCSWEERGLYENGEYFDEIWKMMILYHSPEAVKDQQMKESIDWITSLTSYLLFQVSSFIAAQKEEDRYLTSEEVQRLQQLPPSVLVDMVCKSRCNMFGVWDSGKCLGYAIYPTGSFFNHSCAPNMTSVRSVTDDISLTFHSLREIKKGEEATISYIDIHDTSQQRMSYLLQNYFFRCTCVRCSSSANREINPDVNDDKDDFLEKFYCQCGGLLIPVHPHMDSQLHQEFQQLQEADIQSNDKSSNVYKYCNSCFILRKVAL